MALEQILHFYCNSTDRFVVPPREDLIFYLGSKFLKRSGVQSKRHCEAFFGRSNLFKQLQWPLEQIRNFYYNSTDRFVVPPREDLIFYLGSKF